MLGAAGQPLDVGRASYTAPPAIRRALNARDGGCAFPGCARPTGSCEAHHIQHWSDRGPTAVHNMVLLCGTHHRAVHHDDWAVHIADDGIPEFIPPMRVDPTGAPRRAKLWRAPLAALATPPRRPAP